MKALLHLWKAFGFSLQGLRDTLHHEMAFRIECFILFDLIFNNS